MQIRTATTADASGIAAIYKPIVLETSISWEYEAPTEEEMANRISKTISTGYPFLVAEEAGQILGYAYASPFRERVGYSWVTETSIYLAEESRGKGLGKQLYSVLIEILKRQGFAAAVGGVAGGNQASRSLHSSLGFQVVGVFMDIGQKFDQWWSAEFYQLGLNERAAGRPKPTPYSELLEAGTLTDLLPNG